MTPNMGPQFSETAYISNINRAKKVKSDAQVAMNEISDPTQIYFSLGWLGDSAPNSNISKPLKLSETSRARKLIFGQQVNTDKANNRINDVTR